jgi:hypothetical protein
MIQPSMPPASLSPVALSRDQIVASSSGWLAVSLNLGCNGGGYIYQRRWKAFWLGGLAATAAAMALGITGAVVGNAIDQGSPEGAGPLYGAIVGANAALLGVGIGSSLEAGLAVNRARRRLQG